MPPTRKRPALRPAVSVVEACQEPRPGTGPEGRPVADQSHSLVTSHDSPSAMSLIRVSQTSYPSA
jgi:hypothetical protein